MSAVATAAPRPRVLGGETLYLGAAVAIHAGNYLVNLVMGRALGPAGFAELNLIVTFMVVVGVATNAVQLSAAHASATLAAADRELELVGVHRWLRRGTLRWSALAAVVLALVAPWLQDVFNSPSPLPLLLFAAGLPAYVLLGADRGVLQGRLRFGRLAATNLVEMLVRLVGAIALVAVGLGVAGAVGALVASFVAALWLARDPGLRRSTAPEPTAAARRALRAVGAPSLALMLGHLAIGHADVLVVKANFDATTAGQYAALALVGRIVLYVTVTAVEVVFPMVATRVAGGADDRVILRLTLAGLGAISTAALLVAALVPDVVVGLLFGDAYAAIEPLLWRYTLATVIFSAVVVLTSHRLAAGDGSRTWLLPLAGVLQVIVLHRFGSDLAAVVDLQIGLLCLLLAGVLLGRRRRSTSTTTSTTTPHPRS